jgi:hypothetical protein
MFSYFKKLFMGLNANNVSVANQPATLTKNIELSKQEIEFLLTLVKNSTFKGDMIEIVYKTVYKLQDYYVKLNK